MALERRPSRGEKSVTNVPFKLGPKDRFASLATVVCPHLMAMIQVEAAQVLTTSSRYRGQILALKGSISDGLSGSLFCHRAR